MNGLRTLAIILMILLAIETTYIIWAVHLYNQEVKNTNSCFYEICQDYYDAWYEDNLCYCIDEYNNWENPILMK